MPTDKIPPWLLPPGGKKVSPKQKQQDVASAVCTEEPTLKLQDAVGFSEAQTQESPARPEDSISSKLRLSTSSVDFLEGSRVLEYNGSQLILEIGLHYGSNMLFDVSRIVLTHGSVHAVVAPNGFGKSSFLASLTSVSGFPNLSVALIRSDWVRLETHDAASGSVPSNRATPLDYLLHTSRHRKNMVQCQIRELEQQLSSDEEISASVSERLGVLYEVLDSLDERAMQASAEEALRELGFTLHGLHRLSCSELSGGWLYRLKLASTLLSRPELLIIDEPSFLDEQATKWLIHFLGEESAKASNAIVLVVTHKERLLNMLASQILYISPGPDDKQRMLRQFSGSYESFLFTQDQETAHVVHEEKVMAFEEAAALRTDKTLRKEQKKADAGYAKRTQVCGARALRLTTMMSEQKAHSALKNRAMQSERVCKRLESRAQGRIMKPTVAMPPLKIRGEAAGHADSAILSLSDVNFDYNTSGADAKHSGATLLQEINCSLYSRDRVALIGENGAGKSTLLKLIVGALAPNQGQVRYPHPLRVVYFPQNAAMELVLLPQLADITALDLVMKVASGQLNIEGRKQRVVSGLADCMMMTSLQARSWLGQFGLTKTVSGRRVASLSTGERTRLYLCLLMLGFDDTKPPNLLILDEISDNLDVDSVDSIIETLGSFEGAVLAVSHESVDFLDKFAQQEWRLQQGRLITSQGGKLLVKER